jgi:hypothetical protein
MCREYSPVFSYRSINMHGPSILFLRNFFWFYFCKIGRCICASLSCRSLIISICKMFNLAMFSVILYLVCHWIELNKKNNIFDTIYIHHTKKINVKSYFFQHKTIGAKLIRFVSKHELQQQHNEKNVYEKF